MFQHPSNMQTMVEWKLEGPRRAASARREARLARPRCRFERPGHSWTAWITRPRRTRSAPKPTIA